MHIKTPTVIPAGFKITKLPTKRSKAKSIRTLLRIEERKLERQEAVKVRADKVSAALRVGYTIREALKLTEK